MIGGGMGMNNSKSTINYSSYGYTDEVKYSSVNINPQLSYFVVKGLALGITPSYSYSKSKISYNPNETSSYTFSIGPAVRYYVPIDRMAFFAHVNYNFGWSTTRSSYYGIDSIEKYTSHDMTNIFKGGVGATYFIRNNIGLEGFLFYMQDDIKEGSGNPLHSNSSSPSINFNIGLQIFLQRTAGE